MPRRENQALYKPYEALALETPEATFVGRLATYRHHNMDQALGQALATFRRIAQAERRAPAAEALAPSLATIRVRCNATRASPLIRREAISLGGKSRGDGLQWS